MVKYNFISLYFQSWMDKAPMNKMRFYVASATLMNKIYASGGFGNRSVEVYDPVLDVWEFLPQMTEIRSNAACVAFKNNIYVIGGYGNQIHTSVEIFNPATNEWSFGPSLQVRRFGARAVVYHDKIFVIGGIDDDNRTLKTVEVYDPLVSPNFKLQEKQLNSIRSNFAVTVTDDKILIMGGYCDRGVTNTTEMYDDKDKEWKVSKPMKFARSSFQALTLTDYTLNYKDFV